MSAHRTPSLLLAAVLTVVAGTAWAQDDKPRVALDAELLTPLMIFNDGDFDRTEPSYNANRQHVGLVGTLFRPAITFHVLPTLRIRYQAEVGLNLWSRNNADEQDATANDVFLLVHKQVYAEGDTADGKIGFKVGYDRWSDPTRLMFAHWTGAAMFRARWDRGQLMVVGGLLPDATFEGWEMVENNFTHDIFFGGVGALLLAPEARVAAVPGAAVLVDRSEVDRTLTLVAPHLHLALGNGPVHLQGTDIERPPLQVSLDLIGQFGTHTAAALDGEAERQIGWAAQVHARAQIKAVTVTANVMALSPDDALEGNGVNTGFHYSGFSRSSTLWLSENELVDLANNLDERLGTVRGGHHLMRMGLLQGDVKVAWTTGPVFEPALIVGLAGALRPSNALDHGLVGLETDLDLCFRHRDVLEFHLIGSLIVPGGAAAAAVNLIDREATDPQFGGMSMLAVRF
jgi:hypothetical protein